ncbi:MAG: nicotinate (nicotinamide) nucleotide adenylyltransferase [Campylobacter sp.]|nr:nicotinate (nicotinamide) nucleotide adenylyltransferase [Campylobacter sp.]
MKIALFGGSFDPPHLGHEYIVKKALTDLDIDKLIIMPAYINPFKSGYFAPPNLRLKWLKTIFDKYEKIEISDFEISQKQPVSTIKSITYIKKTFSPSKIYIIIGADNLESLHKWSEFENLNTLTQFVVASRDGIEIPTNLQKLDINANISSTKFRKTLNLELISPKIKGEVAKFYRGIDMSNIKKRVEAIVKVLEDKKAENVEVVDMSDKEYISKFVVIATTLTGRHGASLADDIELALKPFGEKFLNVESSDEWTAIDLGDTIIHLMSDEYRAKYDIEEFLKTLKF